jgi:ABC-type multidrug transport system fused ATPase/permease subunit
MSITIIVIAHRLSTIMNCNRIVVLENGEVCEMGSHLELMEKNGVYKSLVERQIQGIVTDENEN